VNGDAPGLYLERIRDIFVEAGVVQIEVAAELLGPSLDAAEIDMIAGYRRLGWHAVRLDPAGTGAWITLIHATNDSVGLQAFRHDGTAVADEAWFTFDDAGVAAIAAALHT